MNTGLEKDDIDVEMNDVSDPSNTDKLTNWAKEPSLQARLPRKLGLVALFLLFVRLCSVAICADGCWQRYVMICLVLV